MKKIAPPHPLSRYDSWWLRTGGGKVKKLSIYEKERKKSIYDFSFTYQKIKPKLIESFTKCEELRLDGLQIFDGLWTILGDFQSLQRLELIRCICNFHDFASLASCTSLQRINFGMTKITNKELKTIGKLTNITHLNLYQSRIRALHILDQLKKLVEVDLGSMAISDKELRTWKKGDELEKLFLEGTRVTDIGVAELARFPKLKLLTLQSTKVTTKVYEAISHLPSLETVYLGVDPGPDAIPHLKKLTKLKELYLGDCQIPGITERIQQELSINVY